MAEKTLTKVMTNADCALFLACYKVDPAEIEKTLKKGVDINAIADDNLQQRQIPYIVLTGSLLERIEKVKSVLLQAQYF